jgi:ABC-2 type transport system permease protein
MRGRRLTELIRKDLKLFARDRQAVVLSLLVPVMIASILGWMDVASSSDKAQEAIPIDFVDLDGSPIAKALFSRLAKDSSVKPIATTEAKGAADVAEGSVVASVVVPKDFGELAGSAFGVGSKPEIRLVTDPAHPLESQIVKGAVMQAASEEITQASFGAFADVGSSPVTLQTENAAASIKAGKWASAAHDFAGFGMQGLLFFAMEAAVGLSRERRQGMWQRLRSSPLPLGLVLWARCLSSAVIAFAIIVTMFGLGAILFGIRILGSPLGFLAICTSTALVAATFGILIATLCKSEAQSRGVAFLLIMVMLATGGAWFPMSKMPSFVQAASNWMPVRWAVDGFDAMTWRGQGLSSALQTSGVLSGFAVAFVLVAALVFHRTAYDA